MLKDTETLTETLMTSGVRVAWQVAGDLAAKTAAREIEPIHLLFGICWLEESLKTTSCGGIGSLRTVDTSIRGDVERLGTILREVGITAKDIRQKIRSFISGAPHTDSTHYQRSRTVPRSDASRAVFEVAAEQSKSGVVDVPGLIGTICSLGNPEINECLAGRAKAIAELACQHAHDAQLPKLSPSTANLSSIRELYGGAESERGVTILDEIDAAGLLSVAGQKEASQGFAALCELTWEFGTEGSVDAMLQRVLDELLRIVPAAERGVILVRDSRTNEWMLKAHSPGVTPKVSMTSVRQAIDQKKGFVWRRGDDLSLSQKETNLEAGIYVPMLANGEIFGAVCLDSSRPHPTFGRSDLQLVTALSHQLGLTIAHQELRRELTETARLMERLMTNFSPKVRTRLLQRARQGRLKLGGERATVTIVISDIRGFTRIAAKMEAEDVADMLNDYFAPLTDTIFRNDGTVNDFVGDAILAVFGSPEEDPDHCRKGVVAAIQMQEAAREVSRERLAKGATICEIGIGVHCGDVMHGFIGSKECMNYTVIGDVVNFASRYSAGAAGGEVLLSPDVHQRVWEHVEAEKTVITTKHEGELAAYRLNRLRS